MDTAQPLFSCTLDSADEAASDRLILWLTAVTRMAGVDGGRCHVHLIADDGANPATARALARQAQAFGAHLHRVPVMNDRLRGLSALYQLDTFTQADAPEGETVWLMDHTLLPLEDGLPDLGPALVAAKPVDMARPASRVVRALFDRAGLDAPRAGRPSFATEGADETTAWNNANQRLYGIRRAFLPTLAPFWRKWVRWLLDQTDLLGDPPVNVLQLGFALAMGELGQSMRPLDLEWSVPGRLLKRVPNSLTPRMMHVEPLRQPGPTLGMTGRDALDRRLATLNTHLADAPRPEQAPAPERDTPAPALTVPVTVDGPRALMRHMVYGIKGSDCLSILNRVEDVTENPLIPGSHYLTQHEDVARAIREADPTARIHRGGPDSLDRLRPVPVIIAQTGLWDAPSRDAYVATLKTLAAKATRRLILVGLEYFPLRDDGMTFFGPLSEHVQGLGGWSDVILGGHMRERAVVIADRDDTAGPDTVSVLAEAAIQSANPARLRLLVDMARNRFGFFTRAFERAVELPWALSHMPNGPQGRVILDAGAGISPLPLYLAEGGATVDCVDRHSRQYDKADRDSWSENGFVDYGRLHSGLRAFHQDITDFQPPADRAAGYDTVLMLGMLHQMDLISRRRALAHVAELMAPGAVLLATVRLVPGTNWLQPVSEGRVLGRKEQHGHVRELVGTLEAMGLMVEERRVRRNLPHARSDVMELQCRKRTF
ncbi:SAM-dependent methyltransferase [Yunchengibacter salinarum]|uniref:SAM-dependent methyltransferase n=1 Tax=Yunchengibacter salinarum TaxID=3133399 RepID=UPI0035B5E693